MNVSEFSAIFRLFRMLALNLMCFFNKKIHQTQDLLILPTHFEML